MDDIGPGMGPDGELGAGEAQGQTQAQAQERDRGDRLKLAPIDHHEYDALADLFLGDGGLAPETVVSGGDDVDVDVGGDVGGEDEAESPVTHETHTPVLQLTRHEEDAQIGQAQTTGMGVLETLEMSDAHASELLAELMGEGFVPGPDRGPDERLDKRPDADAHGGLVGGLVGGLAGELDGSGTIELVEMPMPRVEVVVLGHLPVRATLWARQYACHVAQATDERVALVRAASGSTSVDLIGGESDESIPAARHLDDALVRVSTHADRVILRVDESSEGELLDRVEVEEITILSGADEAAIVASYRLIKALDATLTELYGDDDGPVVRVAVMGAGREQAGDARAKLENAARTFIDRPIEIVVGSGRIDATGTTNIYRDSIAHRASEIVDGLVDAARGILAAQVPEADVQEAEPVIDRARVEFPVSGVEMPSVGMRSRDAFERADSAHVREGLSALIAGLSPIEARCPKAPGVELAIDGDGQLHLIVCDGDTSDAMNRLMAAQSWARNNLGLLIRAEPGLAMPGADRYLEADAAMHLISAEPRSVREIYDTQVRVYALARVRVGGVEAQVATPIN